MKTRTQKLNTLTLSIVLALAAACAADKPGQSEVIGEDSRKSPVESPVAAIMETRQIEPTLTRADEQEWFRVQDGKVQDSPVRSELHSRELKPGHAGIVRQMPSAPGIYHQDSFRIPRENLYREQYEHPDDQQTLRVSMSTGQYFSVTLCVQQ